MHYYSPWVDPRVKLVRAEQMIAYLRQHAWSEEGLVRKHFFCFRHPKKGAPVLVPTPVETEDYLLCIFEAVTELARIEDRYAGDLLTDLLAQPAEKADAKPTTPAFPSPGGPLSQPANR